MEQKIDVMIDEAAVEARIAEIAQQLSKEYEGKTIHIIGVLKGSVFFMCELAKRLTVPVTMDFMSVSSYGNDTKSSGVVKMIKDLDESIEGRDVVLIEDIMDSGRTLAVHMYALSSEGLYMNQMYATGVILMLIVLLINGCSGMIAKKIAKK